MASNLVFYQLLLVALVLDLPPHPCRVAQCSQQRPSDLSQAHHTPTQARHRPQTLSWIHP